MLIFDSLMIVNCKYIEKTFMRKSTIDNLNKVHETSII